MASRSEGSSEVHGEAEVQKKVDDETAQGFRGVKADPTPNEHYTVAGVIANKPTPENHAGSDSVADTTKAGA